MIKKLLTFALLSAPLLAGCNAFKLKPPAGYAEVYKNDEAARMKGSDDVGLSVTAFPNVRGGTLGFWSEDLVRKLGKRGYTLVGQSPAKSKNGVDGTRFDFLYTPPGTEDQKFFSAVVFATDKNLVVIQVAGDKEHASRVQAQLADISGATRVRGCRSWTKVCDGPQPAKLKTPPVEKPQEDQLADADKDNPDES